MAESLQSFLKFASMILLSVIYWVTLNTSSFQQTQFSDSLEKQHSTHQRIHELTQNQTISMVSDPLQIQLNDEDLTDDHKIAYTKVIPGLLKDLLVFVTRFDEQAIFHQAPQLDELIFIPKETNQRLAQIHSTLSPPCLSS